MNDINKNKLGKIQSVDTNTVIIKIDDEDCLNNLQVNQLITITSTNFGEKIIALISKIMRKSVQEIMTEHEDVVVENLIKAVMVGTWFDKQGQESKVFKRTLEVIPSISADSFLLAGDELSKFMSSVSSKSDSNLEIGKYSIEKETSAYLDGDKFFQRHAVIVGSTGSGKSWTVATILEQAAKLPSVNNIIFDIHGEYEPLETLNNTVRLKIAGPGDVDSTDNVIFLPYWLLSYEETEAILLDRSDFNAPNQARALFEAVIAQKKVLLDEENPDDKDILDNFTIDSPIPYDLKSVIADLKHHDILMVEGSRPGTEKQGPLHGKLTRFIQRLTSKKSDKRLNFMFNDAGALARNNWLDNLVQKLMNFEGEKKGSKIIDCSEVPSDILPLVMGLIARIIFSIQQWTDKEKRHPIALFCDEAHLYMPHDTKDSMEERGLRNFEKIAKEGRKYGVSLIIISQRPADVSRTALSQCNNFIAMRLTNPDDQNVIKRLFPDGLGNFSETLPILDTGEGLIIGDACLLPSRIKINPPDKKPNSATVSFWQEWSQTKTSNALSEAVRALKKQKKETAGEPPADKIPPASKST